MENEEAQVVKLLHTSALDVIQILGLTARGRHGVYPSERANGQSFSVDVTMHVDTRAAATDDDLSLTVDYSAVAEDVVEILSGNPVYLIETLAQRVAEAVLNYESVQIVEVKVHKPNAPMDLKFSDVSMTIRRTRSEKKELSTPLSQRVGERESITAVIGLGANLDDPWKTLAEAVMEIDSHAHMNVVALSGLFASEPVLAAGQNAQPEYYNAVAHVQTTLTPHDLLAALQEIENTHGRVRTERWGARTLDLDIIAIEGFRLDTSDLTVPHPRAHERAFVLIPWTQIDSEASLGKRGRVKVLAEQVGDQKIRSVADVWVEQALSGEYPGTEPVSATSDPQETPEPTVEPVTQAEDAGKAAATVEPVAEVEDTVEPVATPPVRRTHPVPAPGEHRGGSPLFARLQQSRKEADKPAQATKETAARSKGEPQSKAKSAERSVPAIKTSLPRPGRRSASQRQPHQVGDGGPTWSRPREEPHVRIIDDIDEKDEVVPRRHATGAATSSRPHRSRRPIMKVDLPDTMERGLLPIDDEPTGPIPRSAVRPTVTGAIPIIRKGPRNVQGDT